MSSINGILNINKPAGRTSLWVVNLVRRQTRQRHVGHVGTLDPIAEGVLPVCLGKATRVTPYILSQHKTYVAEIELGIATDTYDIEGTVTQRTDPSNVSREQIEQTIARFRGSILQKPPMYSALKKNGRRLYDLARAGIEVERDDRQVEIYRIDIVRWRLPYFTIEIECGRGTYVRSVAHDIGQAIGCGAYLKGLVRTVFGPFRIENSVNVDQFLDEVKIASWQGRLYPIDTVFACSSAAVVDAAQERDIINGSTVSLEVEDATQHCRAYSKDGRFIALLRLSAESGLWHPEKVFLNSG